MLVHSEYLVFNNAYFCLSFDDGSTPSPCTWQNKLERISFRICNDFLTVTAGFFAETLREHISERKKEKEYMVSMIADLKEDTADITQINRALFRNIRGQDSLILLLKSFHETDSTAKQAYRYYLRYTIAAPQVIFNEGTVTQLLGSGNMQLVADHGIADSITAYTSYIKFDKVQAGYYNDQFRKCLIIQLTCLISRSHATRCRRIFHV